MIYLTGFSRLRHLRAMSALSTNLPRLPCFAISAIACIVYHSEYVLQSKHVNNICSSDFGVHLKVSLNLRWSSIFCGNVLLSVFHWVICLRRSYTQFYRFVAKNNVRDYHLGFLLHFYGVCLSSLQLWVPSALQDNCHSGGHC